MFDETQDINLFGELMGLNGQQSIMMHKMMTNRSRGSRGDMEKHFKALPDHIKRDLAKGKLRYSDLVLYYVAVVKDRTVKLFESQVSKQVGVTNVSNGALPKNMAFAVSGMQVLAGVAPVSAEVTLDEALKATDFQNIKQYPALANGQFRLTANKKDIVPELASNRLFAHDKVTDDTGYYQLDNPRLIVDEVEIEWTITLPTMVNIPENLVLAGFLHGTATIPS